MQSDNTNNESQLTGHEKNCKKKQETKPKMNNDVNSRRQHQNSVYVFQTENLSNIETIIQNEFIQFQNRLFERNNRVLNQNQNTIQYPENNNFEDESTIYEYSESVNEEDIIHYDKDGNPID